MVKVLCCKHPRLFSSESDKRGLEQIQELQTFIAQQNRLGNGVAVHCTSGRRRTGTMLACYLIDAGSSYDDAIQVIQTANPEVELREVQTSFLRELAEE